MLTGVYKGMGLVALCKGNVITLVILFMILDALYVYICLYVLLKIASDCNCNMPLNYFLTPRRITFILFVVSIITSNCYPLHHRN